MKKHLMYRFIASDEITVAETVPSKVNEQPTVTSTNKQPTTTNRNKQPKMTNKDKQPTVTTMGVNLIKNSRSKLHIMQFNESQRVNFASWKKAKLQRENNSALVADQILDEPKYGAGSTFGRAAGEEARNRRYGRIHEPKDQPWLLTTNETDLPTNEKHFKGLRAGGIFDNSDYYIFVMNADGKSLSAYPVEDWYRFHSNKRYKTLSFEKAEEQYSRRDNIMSYFSLMTKKRLRNEVDENDEKTTTLNKSLQDLTILEVDEWINTYNEDNKDCDADSNQSDNDNDNDKVKKKIKKDNLKKKKASDSEALEDSDDGDDDGREIEYMTESSASESELDPQNDEGMKSVAEEIGLTDPFGSDVDSDLGSDSEPHNHENEDDSAVKSEIAAKTSAGKRGKAKRGETRGYSDKRGSLEGPNKENQPVGDNLLSIAEDKIAAQEYNFRKRAQSVASDGAQAKRSRRDSSTPDLPHSPHVPGAWGSGITVRAVSKYLQRKPMALVELLREFRKKKPNFNTDEIERILILTLQQIKANQLIINGVTYYSL